jgi:predicted AlkP superfamily phosphohydrolase/phosphomutase
MDPDHPLHGNLPRQMFPNAILDVHKHLDAAIGHVLERVDADATVLIMSDHGFRGEYNRLAVNNWLQKEGLLTAHAQAANLFYRFGMQLKRMGLQKQAVAGLRALIGTRRPEKLYYRSVNWPQTKVIYGPGQGFYINMKGRDEDGVVTEAEYEPLRDYIIEKMKEFRDPISGLPVVSDVFRREELYEGEAFAWAPDIVPGNAEYKMESGKVWGLGMSKFLGAPELFIKPRELSGTHSPEGIFIAWGPHVRPDHLENLRIMDIAPTALYGLGLAVPRALDGRVLTEVFTSGFVEANPVCYGDIDVRANGKSGQVLSESHEELVEDRLRQLGYL